MTVSRRGFLGGLAALGFVKATGPVLAEEAPTNSPDPRAFYLTTSRAAFDATFGDRLSVESVRATAIGASGLSEADFDALSEGDRFGHYQSVVAGVVNDSYAAYSDNWQSAMQDYFSGMNADDLATLQHNLTRRYERNGGHHLWAQAEDDLKNLPRGRIAIEHANPLYGAFYTLQNEGIIPSEGTNEILGADNYVDFARDLTFSRGDDGTFEPFHQAMFDKIRTTLEGAPAVESAPVTRPTLGLGD